MSSRNIVMSAAGVGGETYIEDVFSTYLYTGTGANQTINNGIDLAGKGGMVWCKLRSTTGNNNIHDTVRGYQYSVFSESTSAQTTSDAGKDLTSFNSNGFSIGPNNYCGINTNGESLVSWTFRKAPKFFDVVTYTGDGAASKVIPHNLGSVPGMIITKSTTVANNWWTYHRSVGNTAAMRLQTTDASLTASTLWNDTSPTDSNFTVGVSINETGQTYVAYLFAHDTDTDGLIQCGSFTDAANTTVDLGWEPQYVLVKSSNQTGYWYVFDTMRGMSMTTANALCPNSTMAELPYSGTGNNPINITATGFNWIVNNWNGTGSGTNMIYMAIRRGPMRTPTDATKVFAPVTYSGTGGAAVTQTTGFPVDFTFNLPRNNSYEKNVFDRLRGWPNVLYTNLTAAEATNTSYLAFDNNTGVYAKLGSAYPNVTNGSGWTYVTEAFQRAPGFFDVVCYTGNGGGGSGLQVKHNLGVAPELVIIKERNSTYVGDWGVYCSSLTNPLALGLALNTTLASSSVQSPIQSAIPSATGFYPYTFYNQSGTNYVAYLFASCPGVSKVGSYTGTGSTQTISCGFTGGARFVLIKRTDSTGDWYVWDTARGMVSGTDPSLLLNSTAAEVNANSVYTTTGGFQIVSTDAGINASGGSYIYLAVA